MDRGDAQTQKQREPWKESLGGLKRLESPTTPITHKCGDRKRVLVLVKWNLRLNDPQYLKSH